MMVLSSHSERYRTKHGFCYTESGFIDYLNEHRFPEQKSVFVKNLGWTELRKKLPIFNFDLGTDKNILRMIEVNHTEDIGF